MAKTFNSKYSSGTGAISNGDPEWYLRKDNTQSGQKEPGPRKYKRTEHPTAPTSVSTPKKLYTSEEDALKDILNKQGQTPGTIKYSPEAIEFLKKANIIALPSLGKTATFKMLFNASSDDYDPDDYEGKQEEWSDATEDKEPEQVDTEPTPEEGDEEEQVGKFTYDPETLPERPEEESPDVADEADEDIPETVPHEEEHQGDEEEDKGIPIQALPPVNKKFNKTKSAPTDETPEEHVPELEDFEDDDSSASSGTSRVPASKPSRKTTIAIPEHGVQGQDRVLAMMARQNNESNNKMLVRRGEQEGTGYAGALKDTVDELKQMKQKREEQASLPASTPSTPTKQESHVFCGCEKRRGFETPENISKIKQSDDYKSGIVKIKTDPSPESYPGEKSDRVDNFIAESYRCKGDQ